MNPTTISAIRDFTLKVRELMLTEVEEQLEGIYGLLPDGHFEPAEKYPALSSLKEAGETRRRLEKYFTDQEATGVSSKKVRKKLVKEISFTRLNRMVALKMMETRGLIRRTVTKGINSNGFKRWVVQEGNEAEYEKYEAGDMPQNAIGEGPRQEAYRHYILWQCAILSEEIKVLFDPKNLASRIFPRSKALNQLIEMMNVSELEEAWAPGGEETIGWVYQFFNENEKKEVFDRLYKKKQKIKKEDIPAATELFTPNWIVKWLVQNSLGRYWMQMHPDSRLADELDYLVPLSGEIPSVPLKRVPEIKMLDPACGTMHFGLVAFDLFYQMYREELEKAGTPGWPETASIADEKKIPAAIITNNLYGIDIDLRAVQLSAMALYIKAKSIQKDSRITETHLGCADVMRFDEEKLEQFLRELDLKDSIYARLLTGVWSELENLAVAGSLLRFESKLESLIKEERKRFDKDKQMPIPGFTQEQIETEAGKSEFWEMIGAQIYQALDHFAKTQAQKGSDQGLFVGETQKGFQVLDILTRRYDIVATNPPYLSSINMNKDMATFLQQEYPNSKGDLYAAFIERCSGFTEKNGRTAMITQQSFMFISSYEKMRNTLLESHIIETMCHVGPRAFDAISGEKVNTTLFEFRKEPDSKKLENSIGTYFRLVKLPDSECKRRRFETGLTNLKNGESDSSIFHYRQGDFDAIPGSPWVYWLRSSSRKIFAMHRPLGSLEPVKEGINTGDNVRFVRFWWEVSPFLGFDMGAKYVPFCKGSPERKYYDRFDECILNDISQMRPLSGSRIFNLEFSFKPAIAFLSNTSTGFRGRYIPDFSRFCSTGGRAIFPIDMPIFSLLGILNSNLCDYLLKLINPTISIKVGDLNNLPIVNKGLDHVGDLTKEAVAIQNRAVQESEQSFEFIVPPAWENGANDIESRNVRFNEIENQIDKEVYSLYGINEIDRVAIEAEPKDSIIEQEEDKAANQYLEKDQDIIRITKDTLARQWISYAFGIIIDRFRPGIAKGLGRGNFSTEIEKHLQDMADPDGIMVMDEGHSDDLPTKVIEALVVMLGELAAEDVVKTVIKKDGSAEDLLRTYFERTFFKEHIKQYRKRPVYWLLESPKKKYGVWLFHEKMNQDTLFRICTEYVEPKINHLESQIAGLQSERDRAEGRERRQIKKRIGEFTEILDDVREFQKLLKFISEERGYCPHIDDGVHLNMAPLWEVIPSWQSELKKAWKALERGDYDWAYQAMDHWPERVKEKCKTNKSYAIAHGLDDK